MGSDLIVHRTLDIKSAPAIHKILFEAFKHIQPLYTKEAFDATVVNIADLQKRIQNPEYEVLTALYNNEIAGTASVKLEGDKNLYLMSMAVMPEFHGKGIGYIILNEVEKIAKQKNCLSISLETSAPLTTAISLYEKFGFTRTGSESDYHGVTIFEMVKKLL